MDLIPTLPRRPLWTDRQLIAAADLTAEQTWQDARLARLRRYALGWGVVAGFEVEIAGAGLLVRPGYGITPLGHEIYLAAPLPLPDVLACLLATCAPGLGGSCDIPAVVIGEADQLEFGAWLVLCPDTVQSCPRPGVAAGCDHPGQSWALSRQSGALRIEVVCGLDAGLLPDARSCPDIQDLFAGGDVPLPPDVPDMLPLVQVNFGTLGLFSVTTATRRRLLPLAELQAVLSCCDCTQLPDPPQNDTINDTINDTVVDDVWDNPLDHVLADLLDEFDGFFPDRKRDPLRKLAEVFRAGGIGVQPGFLRDPLQAFVAAAVVSSADEFQLWVDGDFEAIYTAARGRGGPAGPRDLARQTLGQLTRDTPNLADVRAQFGTTPVSDVMTLDPDVILLGGRNLDPGSAAMLRFVQLRLKQMVQG